MNTLYFDKNYMLSLNEAELVSLFQKEKEAKNLYRKMANFWHPDKNKDIVANEIFIKIHKSYEKGIKNKKTSKPIQEIIIEDIEKDKTFSVSYVQKNMLDIGALYIGKTYLLYEIDKNYEDLYENHIKIYQSLKYENDEMKKQMSFFVSQMSNHFKSNKYNYIFMKKDKNEVILGDLINYYKNKGQTIDIKHVFWIISSMLNNACFLNYNNLASCSLLKEYILINPQTHSSILNCWLFSRHYNEKLLALPGKIIDITPGDIIRNKESIPAIDLYSIKETALNCLGCTSIAQAYKLNLPKPFEAWLTSPAKQNAIEEYKNWSKVVVETFGKRKFEKFDIDFNTIYN